MKSFRGRKYCCTAKVSSVFKHKIWEFFPRDILLHSIYSQKWSILTFEAENIVAQESVKWLFEHKICDFFFYNSTDGTYDFVAQ